MPFLFGSKHYGKKWYNFDIIPLKNDLYKVTYPTECTSIFFSGSAAWNLI